MAKKSYNTQNGSYRFGNNIPGISSDRSYPRHLVEDSQTDCIMGYFSEIQLPDIWKTTFDVGELYEHSDEQSHRYWFDRFVEQASLELWNIVFDCERKTKGDKQAEKIAFETCKKFEEGLV